MEKFNKEVLSNEEFYNSLTGKNNSDKEYGHYLEVWNTFQMKNNERLSRIALKTRCFIISGCYQKN